MAFGAIVPAALGSVTAGASLTLATPASVETGLVPWGLWDAIHIPSINTVLLCHGAEAMREYLEGAVYRVGIIAPADGMTVAGTATRATVVLTLTGDPATLDLILVGPSGRSIGNQIRFKTAVDGSSGANEVLRGVSQDDTLQNLQKYVMGTGTHGVEYYSQYIAVNGGSDTKVQSVLDVEVSAIDTGANTITFRAITPGTGGNAYLSTNPVDGGGVITFASATFTGGAAGTGTAPSAGEYTYALGVGRVADGTLSGVQPTLVTGEQDGNYNFTLDNFPTPAARDDTDFYRVYRTLVGRKVLYKEEDATADPVTDSAEDDDLVALGSYKYDERIFRSRFNGYPEIRRFGAIWRGRFWKGGIHRSADYAPSAAAVAVTNASATADFSGSTGRPQEDWLGRIFRSGVTGDSIDYLIIDVDASAKTVTFNRVYAGTTAAALTGWSVRDLRGAFTLEYSESVLYNNFPPTNSIGPVVSRDPDGVSGLVSIWDTLVVFTRTGLWRVTGDVGSFRLQNIGEGMGCFGNHCVQVVGGVLYWLGPDGVWAWTGVGDPVSISKPKAEEPEGIQGTIDRINQDEGDVIVSNYNVTQRCIRWWLPLDGETTNDYCLRLDLTTHGFALQTASAVTAAATVPGPNGSFVTIIGDAFGTIWELDNGYIDGAFGFEPKATVTGYAAATLTITCSAASFPTSGDGLKGVPVVVLPVGGPPYEMAKVDTNTGTTLVLTAPPATAPVATDIILVGGIPLDVETAIFDYDRPEMLKWVEGATISHDIESKATEVWCAACGDNDVPTVFTVASVADSCLVNDATGEKHFWLYTKQSRTLRMRLLSFLRGWPVAIRALVVSVRSPEEAEVEG